jgi:hypothetical protein
MSGEMHARAEKLIAQERVEGLAREERQWLANHLRECANCARLAQDTDAALRSLRQNPIPLPPGLAARTQFRVRLRAQEMQEREPKRRLIWIICGMSWALGVATAPYVWRAFEWVGQRTGAPKLLWELGFGLWWTIPALVAAAVLLMEKAGQPGDSDWLSPEK